MEDTTAVSPEYFSIDSGKTLTSDITGIANYTNLAAGIYYTEVIDTVKGIKKMYLNTITIKQPKRDSVIYTATKVKCANSANGTIIIDSINGGNYNPAVSWTKNYKLKWFNDSTETTLTGLTEGNKSLTITDDSGCIENASLTLGGPPQFIIFDTVTHATCEGIMNGRIVIDSIKGGNGKDVFIWLPDSSHSDTLNNITAGYYHIQITDDFSLRFT